MRTIEVFKVPIEDTKIVQLANWSNRAQDLIPYWLDQLAAQSYDGDYVEAYETMTGEDIGCIVLIEDVKLLQEDMAKDQVYELLHNKDSEKDVLMEHIKNNSNLELIESKPISLKFRALQDTNIRDLMISHSNECDDF